MTRMSSAVVADATFGVESWAYVAIRAVQFVAIIVLLGVLSLRLVVLPRIRRLDGDRDDVMAAALSRMFAFALAAIGAIGAATVARLAAQHAAMFGTEEHWSRTTIGALLLQSGWGRGWWLALAGALAGWGATGARARRHGVAWPVLAAATGALVVSLSLSGHPAAAEQPILAVAIDALHVIGAGGWVGSLGMLMVIAVPVALRSPDAESHRYVARLVTAFSPTALAFAAVAALTGTLAAWRNIGSLAALWSSSYGQLLLAKLALLSVAAGTGAYNWKRVLPGLGTAPATHRLQRSASVELAAACVVLIVTAVLVATPMPAELAGTTGP
ncbi:MAG: CopD family protein [Gemmatimonadetes bacterium]|nr:CopD family protein [Gemmatimonadota bacterium]